MSESETHRQHYCSCFIESTLLLKSRTDSPLVMTSKQIIFIQQIKNKHKWKIQDDMKSIWTFSIQAVVYIFAEIHLQICSVWSKYKRSWYHCEISCSVPQVIWVELHLWYHERTQKNTLWGPNIEFILKRNSSKSKRPVVQCMTLNALHLWENYK